jgi:hypothetical protein
MDLVLAISIDVLSRSEGRCTTDRVKAQHAGSVGRLSHITRSLRLPIKDAPEMETMRALLIEHLESGAGSGARADVECPGGG